MEKLKSLKEQIMNCVEGQVYGDIASVDTRELGEAIDMIKDLSEAMYYCTIVEAMEKKKENGEEKYYPVMYYPYFRDMDKTSYGRMYYDGMTPNPSSRPSNSSYDYPMEIRDIREGRSPMSRKTYMESKEMHHDKAVQMKELEAYLKELSEDVTEMVADASPDEKAMLQQKLVTLANKVVKQ